MFERLTSCRNSTTYDRRFCLVIEVTRQPGTDNMQPDDIGDTTMTDTVLIFTGHVVPERAAITIGPITFGIGANPDLPQSTLYLEILLSQIHARLVCPTPPSNILTARNIVVDAVRSILDVGGFIGGRGIDAEIVQVTAADGSHNRVFDQDVPALSGLAERHGLTYDHLLQLMSQPDSWYIRRALSDFRQATTNPADTGFFCYRAVETLMQYHALTAPGLTTKGAKWEEFRNHYGIDRANIDRIKEFADPVRHGDGLSVNEMTDENRADIFTRAWQIGIVIFLREHADSLGRRGDDSRRGT